jgi:hypothetical protein
VSNPDLGTSAEHLHARLRAAEAAGDRAWIADTQFHLLMLAHVETHRMLELLARAHGETIQVLSDLLRRQ